MYWNTYPFLHYISPTSSNFYSKATKQPSTFIFYAQRLHTNFKMRLSTIAAPIIFAVLAAASNETVTVEKLFIRDNDGIQFAELTLQPANVTCSAPGSALANFSVALCGDSKYRFAINGSSSVYGLRLYKELGVG
jgi:hypothetical protein